MIPMVEQLKTDYECYKIPYPIDLLTEQVEKQKEGVLAEIKEFIAKSNERIINYQSAFDNLNCIMPFDKMTIEDYMDAFPKHAPDFLNKPTFWPHGVEEELDYNVEPVRVTEHVLFQQIHDVQNRIAFKKHQDPSDVIMKMN